METLSKLSARALEYYITSRRWKSDLYFSNLEITFLNRLLDEHFHELVDTDVKAKLKQLGNRLSVLVSEELQIKELLELQLENLEQLAKESLDEHTEELAGKQAHLEYLMMDWIHEYRVIKEEFFFVIGAYLDSKRV
jgi:DNA gyrase/topoisomerase IV subunit A